MSGLLNKLISDNTVQDAGTVPGSNGGYSSVNVIVINRTDNSGNVSIWATTSPTPGDVDCLVYENVVDANGGRLEESCRIMSAGEKIFVRAPAGCVVRVETVEDL